MRVFYVVAAAKTTKTSMIRTDVRKKCSEDRLMNIYHIKRIKDETEIGGCEQFQIEQYQWTAKREPKTKGRVGYIPGKGLFVRMFTEETDTVANCLHDREMVCKDSAMEAFFAFPKDGKKPDGTDVLYLNFEVNVLGAMYAKQGVGRANREFLPEAVYDEASVKTVQDDNGWSLSFYVPEAYVKELCGYDPFETGQEFYCNFYKISEDPAIEHYGSYNRIESETPNFHRPQDFAKAVMC